MRYITVNDEHDSQFLWKIPFPCEKIRGMKLCLSVTTPKMAILNSRMNCDAVRDQCNDILKGKNLVDTKVMKDLEYIGHKLKYGECEYWREKLYT